MTILYEPHRRDAQQFGVLLGSDAHTAAAPADLVRLLAEYPVNRPALGVILIRDRLDVGLLGEAIRAGVREVVQANDPAGLLASCARSVEVSRQMGPTSAQ